MAVAEKKKKDVVAKALAGGDHPHTSIFVTTCSNDVMTNSTTLPSPSHNHHGDDPVPALRPDPTNILSINVAQILRSAGKWWLAERPGPNSTGSIVSKCSCRTFPTTSDSSDDAISPSTVHLSNAIAHY